MKNVINRYLNFKGIFDELILSSDLSNVENDLIDFLLYDYENLGYEISNIDSEVLCDGNKINFRFKYNHKTKKWISVFVENEIFVRLVK